jgi:hypothetical protein
MSQYFAVQNKKTHVGAFCQDADFGARDCSSARFPGQ